MSKNKVKWTAVAVLIFLSIFFFLRSSEAAEASFELTSHATYVGGKPYESETLFYNERFDENKYQVGLLLQTRLDCKGSHICDDGEADGNQAFYLQRIVHFQKFELGLGFSYWHKQSPAWNSHTPFALSVGYNFNENLGIVWRHFSTGGSSSHNPGLDMVTIRWRL